MNTELIVYDYVTMSTVPDLYRSCQWMALSSCLAILYLICRRDYRRSRSRLELCSRQHQPAPCGHRTEGSHCDGLGGVRRRRRTAAGDAVWLRFYRRCGTWKQTRGASDQISAAAKLFKRILTINIKLKLISHKLQIRHYRILRYVY